MKAAPRPGPGGNPVGPALDRLIGRRRDLDLAGRALSDSRLVTFTGPGGVGKTRLALELAERLRNAFPDGVWLARLSDLSVGAGEAEVESALIGALGVSDQSATPPGDKLRAFLRPHRLLLVVDNCEHVLPAVRSVLTVVLGESHDLRVIATSREPLGITGEILRPVLPLSVPDPNTPASQLVADGSASLLLERARAVDPTFEVTEDNVAAVVDLCRLLDGLPLAIELAAVKLRTVTVEQAVHRFGRRLTALATPASPSPSRHQSLRAMVDWSYELCPPVARVLWRRLSVFPATFDLDLAEAVCAFGELPPEEVVDSLERLVAQSILLTDRSQGSMRYRLLAPLREFAAELAAKADETIELERRHRDALMQRAGETLDQWCGPHQEALIACMRLDHAGYVAAAQWSASTPGEEQAGLRLLAALRYHWLSGGLLAEGRMRVEALLAVAPQPSPARAECLSIVAWIALLQGDHEQARRWLAELATLVDELDEPRLAAHLHHWSALLALFGADPTSAVEGFRAAAEEHQAHRDRYLELTAGYMLAAALALDGRTSDALAVSRRTVSRCEQCGDRSARAYALWAGALAQWKQGQLDEAERMASTALRLQRGLLDRICVALTTELLACVSHDRGQADHATALSGAASRVWRSLGTSLEAFGPLQDQSLAGHVQPRPERPMADDAAMTGRFPDLGAVIDLGLGVESAGATNDHGGSAQPLTKRELEVAALIESGLSNREIAQRLVIAKRTADGHVERILSKLGFSSRAQVAAWMARRTNPGL